MNNIPKNVETLRKLGAKFICEQPPDLRGSNSVVFDFTRTWESVSVLTWPRLYYYTYSVGDVRWSVVSESHARRLGLCL